MTGTCSTCLQICVFKEPKNSTEVFGYPCDLCKKILCRKCSGISTTELRAIVMNSRVMPYICKFCLPKLQEALQLANRVTALETEIAEVKSNTQKVLDVAGLLQGFSDELKSIKTSVSSSLDDIKLFVKDEIDSLKRTPAEAEATSVFSTTSRLPKNEEVILEWQERQERSKNLMLFNVPEGEDREQVESTLRDICNNPPEIVKTTRIGKPNVNNARALRVVFNSSNDVSTIVRNRSKLKGKRIYVNYDLTKTQRDTEKSVQRELRDRRNKGEDISVRYRNGVPQIFQRKN